MGTTSGGMNAGDFNSLSNFLQGFQQIAAMGAQGNQDWYSGYWSPQQVEATWKQPEWSAEQNAADSWASAARPQTTEHPWTSVSGPWDMQSGDNRWTTEYGSAPNTTTAWTSTSDGEGWRDGRVKKDQWTSTSDGEGWRSA